MIKINIANIGNINTLIIDQLTSYWPTRLEDYKAGKIEVKVHVVVNSVDDTYYKYVKQSVGKTDPACVLIVGFEQATLFLAPYLVDTP